MTSPDAPGLGNLNKVVRRSLTHPLSGNTVATLSAILFLFSLVCFQDRAFIRLQIRLGMRAAYFAMRKRMQNTIYANS